MPWIADGSSAVCHHQWGVQPSPATSNCSSYLCWEVSQKVDSDEDQAATMFSLFLVEKLKACFSTSSSPRIAREKMWESYYKLCASDSFRERWVEEIGAGATSVFFQFITDRIMEHLISSHFSVVPATSKPFRSKRKNGSALYGRSVARARARARAVTGFSPMMIFKSTLRLGFKLCPVSPMVL